MTRLRKEHFPIKATILDAFPSFFLSFTYCSFLPSSELLFHFASRWSTLNIFASPFFEPVSNTFSSSVFLVVNIMKFSFPSFKKSSSSSSVSEMETYPPRYHDARPLKSSSSSRGCLAMNTDTGAILFTVLTIGNGLISLVGGLQYFAAGGSLVPHLDAIQTGAGSILVLLSILMLGLLLTKLKVPPSLGVMLMTEFGNLGSGIWNGVYSYSGGDDNCVGGVFGDSECE